MIELLARTTEIGPDLLLGYFLVFLRVGAAMALLPVVGEQSIPNRVRLVLAIVFTTISAPAVIDTLNISEATVASGMLYLFTEVTIGLSIGISLRLFVFALQIAGSIAAQSTSLSQIFGTSGIDPQPAIGHLLVVSGLALAVTLGLHTKMAALLIYSYELFPAGKLVPAVDLTIWGVWQIAHVFGLAFSLAAPFVVASLIYNIALGAINRAMPQLMVSFVGAPAITAGGLLLLIVVLPLMLSIWYEAVDRFLLNPFGTSP